MLLEKPRVAGPSGLVSGRDRRIPRQGRSPESKVESGPSPVDRARPGSKHHLIVDGQGIPLAVSLTGGNHNDVTHPDALPAHRGYDHDKYRRLPPGPRDPTGDREARQSPRHRPGHLRYVVERTIAWLHDFRRVRIRWERRDDIHEAFLGLAVCRSPIATSNGFVRNRMAGPHRHECWSAALARSGFDADRGSTGRNLDRRRLRFQQRPEDCRQGWGSVPGCPTPGCSSRSAH
ncbi:transposase [Streptomyces antibioticus]|uniref:transposase n=1 Tax=Streptomyces antibioticus TaxID=1890 RepID=UPI00351D9717